MPPKVNVAGFARILFETLTQSVVAAPFFVAILASPWLALPFIWAAYAGLWYTLRRPIKLMGAGVEVWTFVKYYECSITWPLSVTAKDMLASYPKLFWRLNRWEMGTQIMFRMQHGRTFYRFARPILDLYYRRIG
jgi:hypothetical protein